MKQQLLPAASLGLLHGINDFCAGFMLIKYASLHPQTDTTFWYIVYSILAFGGQLPVALWLDKYRELKKLCYSSYILLALSIVTYALSPAAGIVMIGVASAGVHVGGGAFCLSLQKEKSTLMGLFTAPGVLGLAIGTISGSYHFSLLFIILAFLLLFAYPFFKQTFPVYLSATSQKKEMLDTHDFIMISILLFMCGRSVVYEMVNLIGSSNFEKGLIALAIGSFSGKIIGGIMGDIIGHKRWIFISLLLSFLLLLLGKHNLYALTASIGLLQSSIPITAVLMMKSIRSYPATAIALELGSSVLIAGLMVFGSIELGIFKYFQAASFSFFIFFLILILILLIIVLLQRHKAKV